MKGVLCEYYCVRAATVDSAGCAVARAEGVSGMILLAPLKRAVPGAKPATDHPLFWRYPATDSARVYWDSKRGMWSGSDHPKNSGPGSYYYSQNEGFEK